MHNIPVSRTGWKTDLLFAQVEQNVCSCDAQAHSVDAKHGRVRHRDYLILPEARIADVGRGLREHRLTVKVTL